MATILGWLTITGLALIAFGFVAEGMNLASPPFPLALMGLGGLGSLVAGIPWAHTQGNRVLRIVFLGAVGFAAGGAAGLFLGEAAGPSGPENLGTAIGMVLIGFWVGAILFGSLGVWWGIGFHRHSGPAGGEEGSLTR